MKEIIKTQQLKTGCIIIKPRVTLNVFEFKKKTVKSIYPAFINFEGNGFFEKTAIFISDPLFIHHWKARQKLFGKNISTFLPKLIFMEKIKKTLFFNY
jgi:hypothetical protein